MAEKIDQEILDIQLTMARNEVIRQIPPARLRGIIKSLELLELDELDKTEALIKVLELIASAIARGKLDSMHVLEMCNLWSMHFRKLLPAYAYEEE